VTSRINASTSSGDRKNSETSSSATTLNKAGYSRAYFMPRSLFSWVKQTSLLPHSSTEVGINIHLSSFEYKLLLLPGKTKYL